MKYITLSKVYVDDEIKKAVMEVIDSGWYILGEKVKEFERRFSEYIGVKNTVAVSSGTSALFLALKALDIGRGDEVLAPSFSFIASATPIIHVGAKPKFIDINLRTYTMDIDKIEKEITGKTKAIIVVHLYGHPADMDPIMEIAEKYNLYVIEDSCQAHGAEYKGRKVSKIGDIGVFSFYPSKNMTVYGDGGMVVTNDDDLAETIRMLRNHGRKEKYLHELIGYNMRFNEIQAAVGIIQLGKLNEWISSRRRIAKIYNEYLSDYVFTPIEENWAKHVYHMYVIKTRYRDKLRMFLSKNDIATGIHYPIPIHEQPAIKQLLDKPLKLKNTELASKQVLSLPIYPFLKDEEIEYVSKNIIEFLQSSSK